MRLSQQQAAFIRERQVVEREINKDILCLVQTKGYEYARFVASQIADEFKCKPTEPGWQTYTTMQYAFARLFEEMSRRAKSANAELITAPNRSITAEIKDNDSSSRRDGSNPSTGRAKRRRNSVSA